MKRLILAGLLAMLASGAQAASSYLGTDNQDVTITSSAINIPVNLQNSIPAGTNNIGDVDVLSLPSIPTGSNSIGTVGLNAGSNNIGTVSGSTVTSIIKDSGGEEATVTGGKLDVNATITSADVSVSTVGIRGSSGALLTDTTVGSGNALDVLNAGRASLDGKSLVYKSSDNFVVGGALTLTGLSNQVDLQAIGGDCTFNLAGGEAIVVEKNTAEAFSFDYTATNLTINLTAKDASSTCKARMVGAN